MENGKKVCVYVGGKKVAELESNPVDFLMVNSSDVMYSKTTKGFMSFVAEKNYVTFYYRRGNKYFFYHNLYGVGTLISDTKLNFKKGDKIKVDINYGG